MVLLEQSVRGSAVYTNNNQTKPAAVLVKQRANARSECSKVPSSSWKKEEKKVKAQAEQDKAQAEQDKAQAGQIFQDNTEIVNKELAKETKDIKCVLTVQVGKITSNLRSALARSRLLQVHNTECEGEIQQVSKND